jgi:hypothetical protein
MDMGMVSAGEGDGSKSICRSREIRIYPRASQVWPVGVMDRLLGDANLDGKVDGSDFAFAVSDFKQGASQASIETLDVFAAAHGLMSDVPESAASGSLMGVGCGLLPRRCERRQGKNESKSEASSSFRGAGVDGSDNFFERSNDRSRQFN